MSKRVLKVFAVSAIFLTLLLTGCDQIMSLLGGDNPGGSSGDFIDIPDSVADETTYDITENDFFIAINKERTDNSVAAFPSRDTNLEALARRYARVNKVDDSPGNLPKRIATTPFGSCSDAAFFVFSGTSIAVNDAMTLWLSQTGGTAAMRNSGFTKIGIGMTTCPATGGAPGSTWYSAVVLLAKP
jgi:hypothetical protein